MTYFLRRIQRDKNHNPVVPIWGHPTHACPHILWWLPQDAGTLWCGHSHTGSSSAPNLSGNMSPLVPWTQQESGVSVCRGVCLEHPTACSCTLSAPKLHSRSWIILWIGSKIPAVGLSSSFNHAIHHHYPQSLHLLPQRQRQGQGLMLSVPFSLQRRRSQASVRSLIWSVPVLLSKEEVNLSQVGENPVFKFSACS